ncbi:MAG: ACT domain-containing protein, partial [Gammaproteobacteria bacterium]
GTADRLFGALRKADVSVILISQGSSEHSICFAVPEESGDKVKAIVEQAFSIELAQGQVQKIELTNGCGVLAVVGEGMAGLPGIAGRFFHTLGSAGINVRAIAQGASERNISAVIEAKDMTRALRAVHASFYLSAKTISIGLVGPGSVGSALLNQLASEVERLRVTFHLDLRIRAIGNSVSMVLEDQWVNLSSWRDDFAAGESIDLDRFVKHVQADHLPHAVLIDCTANQDIADRYGQWLQGGIHVITPNKLAHSGSITGYRTLKNVSRSAGTHFLYEATVGAGLPVIQTLNDLVETGDEIRSISGIFSGTLAYLFNVFDGRRPFSEIVREAKALGYTEPDPREDLSGMDVARKAVILAREAGLSLELSDLEVESLVPAGLSGATIDHFMEELSVFDAPMAEKLEQANKQKHLLRYTADLNLEDGTARVKLGHYPLDHPFSNINLTDNIVQFVTRRYSDNPLIIRGPGAGPDVTAAGIFADLLRLCSMLRSNHD